MPAIPVETGLRTKSRPNPGIMTETGYVDEAHIPALEPCPQAAAWLPFAHGDQGGPQDPERTPREGPQEAERLTRQSVTFVMKPPRDLPGGFVV